MELFLFEPAKWAGLYSCDGVDLQEVPLGERQSPLNGRIILALFCVFEALYIPCMFAIRRRLGHSCYKILLYIGFVDMAILLFQGVESGLYSLRGDVYCSSPRANFVSGSIRSGLFVAETSADFVLALNRLVETSSKRLDQMLFQGNRTWVWMALCSLFGACYFFYFPSFFSAIFVDWLANPYAGYHSSVDGAQYLKLVPFYYNMLLTFGFPIVYAAFVFSFRRKLKHMMSLSSSGSQGIAFQKIIFVQVSTIAGLNLGSTLIHAITGRLPVTKSLILFGFYCNYLMFGLPPVIYLLVNKTIRRDCVQMVDKVWRKMGALCRPKHNQVHPSSTNARKSAQIRNAVASVSQQQAQLAN